MTGEIIAGEMNMIDVKNKCNKKLFYPKFLSLFRDTTKNKLTNGFYN